MAKATIPYFLSYAHRDGSLVDTLHEDLKVHLAISKTYDFRGWRDTGILAGEVWDDEIQAAILECEMAILLVSPVFLSRPYIVEKEIPQLLDAGKVVIPVQLRRVDIGRQELRGLEKLWMFGLPVTGGGARTYSECRTSLQREQFALALYKAIEDRLSKR